MPVTLGITQQLDSALRRGFSEASVRPKQDTQMSAIIAGLEKLGIAVTVEDGLLTLTQGATVMHTGKALRNLATRDEFKDYFVQQGQHPSTWTQSQKVEYLMKHSDEQYRALLQQPVLQSNVSVLDPNMPAASYRQLTRAERMEFIRQYGSDAVTLIFQKEKTK
jgi:hypothetical protein